jgi:zinc D-Ala-D-Ala carboxypeptidase
MNLSKNFTLEELTHTNSGLPNVPTDIEIAKLTELVNNVLQPIRDRLGKPIKVNSGFRSLAVNKAAGGVSTSQHCKGEAADIEAEDNAELFHTIREHSSFDQLIWEGGNDSQPDWVHVSYKTVGNRTQVLQMKVVDEITRYVTI